MFISAYTKVRHILPKVEHDTAITFFFFYILLGIN